MIEEIRKLTDDVTATVRLTRHEAECLAASIELAYHIGVREGFREACDVVNDLKVHVRQPGD